jgi:class 3 adenylate cyclase
MVGPPGQWSAPSVTEPEETAVDVASWLRDLGLERYEATFRENDLDAKLLPNLTADDLKELGITSLGHRLRLLEAITALRLKDTQADGPVRLPTSQTGNPGLSEITGERRQLTVMFCDLVGSTALSEKLDPEELRSLLHAYRTLCGEVITRYDGFVARYVGDGILTYFGWPTAHEEDAERAVRAALEIVHTVKQASSTEDLSVRIGIATGPVVVGETAGAGDQSKLAVGSTPNLAARLQGLAAADQIVIAASTRRLAGNAFELTNLGEHDLKGIAEPVHAWRVERALVTESRFDANRDGSDLQSPAFVQRSLCGGFAPQKLLIRFSSPRRSWARARGKRCASINEPQPHTRQTGGFDELVTDISSRPAAADQGTGAWQ